MSLQRLRKRFALRELKFVAVGITMTGLNVVVLMLFVDGCGLNASLSNGIRTVVMTQVQFGVHRTYTWRDRRHEALWGQWRRYHVQKVASTVVGQLIFTVLALFGIYYLLAYIASITLTGLVNFKLSDKFVFRHKLA